MCIRLAVSTINRVYIYIMFCNTYSVCTLKYMIYYIVLLQNMNGRVAIDHYHINRNLWLRRQWRSRRNLYYMISIKGVCFFHPWNTIVFSIHFSAFNIVAIYYYYSLLFYCSIVNAALETIKIWKFFFRKIEIIFDFFLQMFRFLCMFLNTGDSREPANGVWMVSTRKLVDEVVNGRMVLFSLLRYCACNPLLNNVNVSTCMLCRFIVVDYWALYFFSSGYWLSIRSAASRYNNDFLEAKTNKSRECVVSAKWCPSAYGKLCVYMTVKLSRTCFQFA